MSVWYKKFKAPPPPPIPKPFLRPCFRLSGSYVFYIFINEPIMLIMIWHKKVIIEYQKYTQTLYV